MIKAENLWTWFGGTWLAIGLLFVVVAMVIGVNGARLDARFEADGQVAVGQVLTKQISSPQRASTVYGVTFEFSTARGESVRGTAEFDPESWDALAERGPIELVYLPDRPSRFRVAGARAADGFLVFMFTALGAVLLVVGAFVLVSAVRMRKGRGRPALSGARASSTVTVPRHDRDGAANRRIDYLPGRKR